MPEIFISYRRSDSLGFTGHLAEHLRNSFGVEHIFRDYETLDIGVRFKQEIEEAILSSSIMLVIIGSEWTEIDIKSGRRRLDRDEDFVRFEIEYALDHGITIIPVLVDGAQMPVAEILPEKIIKITEFNAHSLSEKHWNADVALLINRLASSTGLDIIDQTKDQSSPPYWLTILQPLLYAVPDFFTLLRRPKQFLRKRSFGRPKDLLAALMFFTSMVVIAEIYVSNAWRPEHYSFWDTIYLGTFLWLLVTLLISVPLWLSWLLLGAREHYQRTLVILLYQMTVVIMLTHIGGSIVVTGVLFHNPHILDNGFESILEDRKESVESNNNEDRAIRLEKVIDTFDSIKMGSLGMIATGLGIAMICPLPLWLIISWGGYRESFKRPRWSSWLAFPVFVVMTSVPVIFLASLG